MRNIGVVIQQQPMSFMPPSGAITSAEGAEMWSARRWTGFKDLPRRLCSPFSVRLAPLSREEFVTAWLNRRRRREDPEMGRTQY